MDEWKTFLPLVTAHKDFCEMKGSKTVNFWKYYLLQRGSSMIRGNLYKLITRVLTVPLGSADAERGFSILFHIRNSRRSRLTGKHLEGYLRLRINGPKKISKFQAVTYAQKWKQQNHMLTDSREGIKRSDKVLLVDEDEHDTDKKMYLEDSSLF